MRTSLGLSLSFLLVLTVLAPRPGAAAPITIDFAGGGIVGPRCSDPNPFGCLGVAPGQNQYTFGSATDWQIDSLFAFDFAPPPGTPNGVGTFRFFDTAGDQISGSLETFLQPPPGEGLPPFITLQYTVTGGLGRYTGAVGSGTSDVTLLFDPTINPSGQFCESGQPLCQGTGQFRIAVPEPGSLSLSIAGLIGAGIVALRRRRERAARAPA